MISSLIKSFFTTTKLTLQSQAAEIVKSTRTQPGVQPKPESNLIRVSKLLTDNAVCSRRQAQKLLSLGLVRIAGQRVYQNSLVPYSSQLKLMSNLGVREERPVTKLWMINKPRGYICTESDPEQRRTIYSLIPPKLMMAFGHIMSVGRLDFNSEGLLLMTNDNTLKGILQSPQTNMPRLYRVKVHGRVTNQKLQKMREPVLINGERYGPLDADISRQLSTNSWIDVTLKTGKNRQIRKIMQKCDLQVNKLVRTAYGPYKLGALKHGEVLQCEINKILMNKLKKANKKELTKGLDCLVQVDIRDKAIELAKAQLLIARKEGNQRQLQSDTKKQLPQNS